MKTRIPLLLVFNGDIITALWIHCTPSVLETSMVKHIKEIYDRGLLPAAAYREVLRPRSNVVLFMRRT